MPCFGTTACAYFDVALEIGWAYLAQAVNVTVRTYLNSALDVGRNYFIRPTGATVNTPPVNHSVKLSINTPECRNHRYTSQMLPLPASPILYNNSTASSPLIEYRNVRATYHIGNASTESHSNQADALKDVSFSIHAGERIGIVGHTTSGKSTIFRCLLQEVTNLEMSSTSSILLNGIDIGHIDLFDLSDEITYIAEDTGVFGGSVWGNIDQESLINEDIVISSFQTVKEPPVPPRGNQKSASIFVDSGATNPLQGIFLDSILNTVGIPLTPSQRQLIALARAIAHHKSHPYYQSKSRIVLLDDPTFTLDAETNAAIQGVIRQEFKNCTLLMVSDNVANVIDFDRIMVMKEGTLLEIGSPRELLENNPLGTFANMVDAVGLVGT